jgi:hypothetical protein
MTSEYMHTYDASLDDEFGEKTVSILLDGEESELIFIDHPASEMSVSCWARSFRDEVLNRWKTRCRPTSRTLALSCIPSFSGARCGAPRKL